MIDHGTILRIAAAASLVVVLWLVVGELEARGRQRQLGERWRQGELEALRRALGEANVHAERLA